MPSKENKDNVNIKNQFNVSPEIKELFTKDSDSSPRKYAGTVEVTHGQNISVVKDSGGISKYKGINHDSVEAVKSNLVDPIESHIKFINEVSGRIRKLSRKSDGSGSTLTLVTSKEDKIYTTFVGDSPAWAMEIKPTGKVEWHVLHDSIIQNSPVPFASNVIRNVINDKVGYVDYKSNLSNLPGLRTDEEINIRHVFDRSNLEEGSKLIILAGSDGLTGHIKLSEDKYLEAGLTAKEANNILERYREAGGAEPPVLEEEKEKIEKLVSSGNKDIEKQLEDAAEIYASVIEKHFKENNNAINCEKLSAEILLKSNDLLTKAGLPLLKKDNTSFIVYEAEPSDERTIVVADGNGPNGKDIAEMLTKSGKEYFSAEPNKSSLLEAEGSKSYKFDYAAEVNKIVGLLDDISKGATFPGEVAERLKIFTQAKFGSSDLKEMFEIESPPMTREIDKKVKEKIERTKYKIAFKANKDDNIDEIREQWDTLHKVLSYEKDLSNLDTFKKKHPGELTNIFNWVVETTEEIDGNIPRPSNDKEAVRLANIPELKPYFQPIFDKTPQNKELRIKFLSNYLQADSRPRGEKLTSRAAQSFDNHHSKYVRKIGDALADAGKLMGESSEAPIAPPKRNEISKFLNYHPIGRGIKLALGGVGIVLTAVATISSGGAALGVAAAGFAVAAIAGARAAYKKERMNAEIGNRDFEWKNAINDSLQNTVDAFKGKRFIPDKAKAPDSSEQNQENSKSSKKGFVFSLYKFAANAATLNVATTFAYLHEAKDYDQIRKTLESERMKAGSNRAETSTSAAPEAAEPTTKSHPMQKVYSAGAEAVTTMENFTKKASAGVSNAIKRRQSRNEQSESASPSR